MSILGSSCVFPVPDIRKTADYYVNCLGFYKVEYLDCKEPHICLYREKVEIILLQSSADKIMPNRDMYGYVFTNCEFTKYITAHGYSGLPIDIIKQAIVDALTPVIEINKTRKEKSKKLDTKIFNTKIPQNRSIYDHFAMDKTIQQNFEELMDMYNIKLFQDFDTL